MSVPPTHTSFQIFLTSVPRQFHVLFLSDSKKNKISTRLPQKIQNHKAHENLTKHKNENQSKQEKDNLDKKWRNKQTNKPDWNKKAMEYTAEFILCCLTSPGHETCHVMWCLYPGIIYQKTNFPLLVGIHYRYLLVRPWPLFPLACISPGIPSGLNLCRSSENCYSL